MNPFISPRFDEGQRLHLAAMSYTELWMRTAAKDHRYADGHLRALLTYLSMRAQTYTGSGNLFDTRQFCYHYASFHIFYQEIVMKQKINSQPAQERAPWQGFIDYRLAEAELVDCDQWTPSEADIWELVERCIMDGLRIQLSYSAKLGLATATFTDYRPGSKTAGYALSGQDANAALALKLLLYKHTSLLQGNWLPLLSTGTRGRRG